MREIKFRGICEQSEKFKYGYVFNPFGELLKYSGIIPENGFSHSLVIKETIGQFTGMLDKHGAPIFEGDIINWHGLNLEVKFIVDGWFAENADESITEAGQEWESSCSVIGNIHQHAHLLEQSKC